MQHTGVISMDQIVARMLRLASEKGYTQKTFAEAIGVRPQAITEWKNGTTQSYARRLNIISSALETTPSFILTGDKREDPTTVSDDEAALDRELISRLVQLTPEEMEKVDAFVQGLLAAR